MPNEEVRINVLQRSQAIPSCSLSKEDLVKVFKILEAKAKEAAELEVKNWVRQDDDDKFDEMAEWVRGLFKVTVTIEGGNGERRIGTSVAIFEDMPASLYSVYYNTLSYYTIKRSNLNPLNWASVLFDFTKPPKFDYANPVSAPTLNNSNIHVVGNDDTWVSAVFHTINELVGSRKTDRDRLHRQNIYDLVLWAFWVPVTFMLVKKVSPTVDALGWSAVPTNALYVYIFFMSLAVFRGAFSYTKWVWPKVEIEDAANVSIGHRTFWVAVSTSLVAAAIWALVT